MGDSTEYVRRAGGALGGYLVGVAISVGINPILAAHHWPLISQQLTDALIGLGGGVTADVLATQTRAAAVLLADRRKRDELLSQQHALSLQIASLPDNAANDQLLERLERRMTDWNLGVIDTATFDAALDDLRSDYLAATGSGPRKRPRKTT